MRSNLIREITVAMAFLGMSTSFSGGDVTDSSGSAMETTLAKMTQLGSGVSSGRLLVVREATSFGRDGASARTKRTESEAWFDPVRFRMETRVSAGNTREETWWLFDGERVVETSPPAFKTALIGYPSHLSDLGRYRLRGLANVLIYWPLHVPMYHLPSLGEQLPGWSVGPLRLAGEDTVGGVRCQVLEVPPLVTDCSQVVAQRLWIAPERGYAVARFEQDVSPPSTEPVSRLVIVDEAVEWLHPIEGLWLPRVAMSTKRYTDRATGLEWLGYRTVSEVVAAEFNIEIPDSVFQLKLPDTTEIIPWDPEEDH